MRKVLFVLSLLLASSVFLVTFFGMKRSENDGYFTIPEARALVYEEGRRMSLDIYSYKKSSPLTLCDSSSYMLKTSDAQFHLENVTAVVYKEDSLYGIRISADVPYTEKEYSSEESFLVAVTPKGTYSFTLGSFSLLNADAYPLLSLDTLYGSYFYSDGMLYMAGINMKLTKSAERITMLRFGAFCYANLSKLSCGVFLDNVIDAKASFYDPYDYQILHQTSLTDSSFFAPLGYKKLELLREGYLIVALDGVIYYVDVFSYMTSMDYLMYEDLWEKGEATNA